MKRRVEPLRQNCGRTTVNGELANPSERRIKSAPSALFPLFLALTLAACGGSSQTSQQQKTPPAQFFVEPNPQAPLMMPGTSLQVPITVLPVVGSPWSGVIAVTISGGTSGLTVSPASFSVDTTKGSGETITVTASATSPTGVNSFTVTGTSGNMVASAQLVVAVVPPSLQATALHANLLYNFSPQEGSPAGPLIADRAGDLYGVAGLEIYKLSYVNGAWQESVLYTFPQVDTGPLPYGSLVIDSSGNLYGVTAEGGSTNCGSPGCGMVYELSFTASGWQPTILFSFSGGADGYEPGPGLVMDKAGNLYGTTRYGGNASTQSCAVSGGCGTVFTLTHSQSGWAYSVIYNFQGTTEGYTPNSAMIFDQQGNLYGTTEGGGYESSGLGGNSTCTDGCGTVFELTPAGGAWQETTVYRFLGLGTDGVDPTGVVMDTAGNLYGSTTLGGFTNLQCSASLGNFFELSPTAGGWTFTNRYYFMGCNLGYSPSGLVSDQAGNFYGVASGGPPGCDFNLGCGVVFRLSQTGQGWAETAFYDFPGGAGGDTPSSMTLVGGKLYGTSGEGIFEISP